MTSIFTVAGARISRLANNIYLSKSAYVFVKPPTLALNNSPISLLSSLSKQKSDTTEFGTIELPIDEKVVFNKFDLEKEDDDAQDKHDEIISDVYRPNSEQYLRQGRSVGLTLLW